MLSELLYAVDLVVMSETIERLRNKFLKWKEAFESKGLTVHLETMKVMVSGSIALSGLSKSKVDPCMVCSLRVKANSALCVQCGKWLHGRCARLKRVNAKVSRNFACRICEGNIGEAVEQGEKFFDEVESVMEFTYLGDRMCVGGGCEAAVSARTKCGWVMFSLCSALLYARRFPLRLIGAVYKLFKASNTVCK